MFKISIITVTVIPKIYLQKHSSDPFETLVECWFEPHKLQDICPKRKVCLLLIRWIKFLMLLSILVYTETHLFIPFDYVYNTKSTWTWKWFHDALLMKLYNYLANLFLLCGRYSSRSLFYQWDILSVDMVLYPCQFSVVVTLYNRNFPSKNLAVPFVENVIHLLLPLSTGQKF